MKKEKPLFYLLIAFGQAFVAIGQFITLHNANYQWRENKTSFVILTLSALLLVLSVYKYRTSKKV